MDPSLLRKGGVDSAEYYDSVQATDRARRVRRYSDMKGESEEYGDVRRGSGGCQIGLCGVVVVLQSWSRSWTGLYMRGVTREDGPVGEGRKRC